MRQVLIALLVLLISAAGWACAPAVRASPIPAHGAGTDANWRPAAPQPGTQRLVGPCGTTYLVRRGDTLTGIALRCRVSWRSIMTANSLPGPKALQVGQRIFIPYVMTYTAPASRSGDANPTARPAKPTRRLPRVAPTATPFIEPPIPP